MMRMVEQVWDGIIPPSISVEHSDEHIQQAQQEGIFSPYKIALSLHTDQPIPLHTISLSAIEIARIPALLPTLAKVRLDSGKITNIEIIAPPYLYMDTHVTVDGARELKQFLRQAIANNAQQVVSLTISAEQNPYAYSYRAKSLERLTSLFPQVEQKHLPNLKHLEFTLTPCSYEVIKGIEQLIRLNRLSNLISLHILLSPKLLNIDYAELNKTEDTALADLYRQIRPDTVPNLRFLTVAMWCYAPFCAGLDMLEQLYPCLQSLTIYRAGLNKSLKIQLRTRDIFLSPRAAIVNNQFINETKNWVASPTSLESIIKLHANDHQLKQFEIYDVDKTEGIKSTVNEIDIWCEAGYLPYLTTITLTNTTAKNSQRFSSLQESIGVSAAVAAHDSVSFLVEAPLESAIKWHRVEVLHLSNPETDFLSLFHAIDKGKLPQLKRIHYSLPYPLAAETDLIYQQRINHLCFLIQRIITEGKLSYFEAFIIEGSIPDIVQTAVTQLEKNLLLWQFEQKLKCIGLIATRLVPL